MAQEDIDSGLTPLFVMWQYSVVSLIEKHRTQLTILIQSFNFIGYETSRFIEPRIHPFFNASK